jgi:hypothetical protein
MRDGAGNALVSTSLPATTNNLAGRHAIVVDGAVKVLPISGFSTDSSSVAAIRSPVVRVPIVFSTPVNGVTIDAFRLLLNGRSVSLRGAQVTGSGTSYELILPSRRANPRGIYTLEVRNDTGISAELNGAQMAATAAFYWGRGQSVGATRNAQLRAFASLR